MFPLISSRVRIAQICLQEWPFLTDNPTPIPSSMFRSDCGKLYSWHNMPSNPPSKPNHQHRADFCILSGSEWQLLLPQGKMFPFARAVFQRCERTQR